MMSSGGGLEPDTDIIQILSLKTNNQMQSYSPPALSLSNQSSLPVLLQRKLLTFSLTYELGNTHTVVTHEPVIS